MNTKRIYLCSILALSTAVSGCASHDEIGQQEADYKLWQPSQKCIVRKSLEPAVKICVHGEGDLERGRDLVSASLIQWLDAVRGIHPGVTDQIEFTCDSPHGYVRIRNGSGRAFASPGKTTVYNKSKLGTYLHEFGHAFACLGDTYRNNTAGKCQAGHPNSIMCDGFLRTDLTEDDVTGVRTQFIKMVGLPDPSDDVPNPPPSDPNDIDHDGVPNAEDQCPDTPFGSHVSGPGPNFGCAEGQTPSEVPATGDADDDGDGVVNKADRCPTTPEGEWVWEDQHDGKWKGCAPGEVPVW